MIFQKKLFEDDIEDHECLYMHKLAHFTANLGVFLIVSAAIMYMSIIIYEKF